MITPTAISPPGIIINNVLKLIEYPPDRSIRLFLLQRQHDAVIRISPTRATRKIYFAHPAVWEQGFADLSSRMHAGNQYRAIRTRVETLRPTSVAVIRGTSEDGGREIGRI